MTMEIPICKLCLLASATQTGSHMLSCFMVESMAGKRGQEKIYYLTNEPVMDHLINVGDQAVVKDHLLCRGCEQRLSYLEGYISQEYVKKIAQPSQIENFPIIKQHNEYILKECTRLNSAAFTLLVASIVWRISLATSKGFADFSIPDLQMEHLRKCINDLLPPYTNYKVKPDRKQWLQHIEETLPNYPLFSYAIFTASSNANKKANLVVAPHFIEYPYSLMLNEYIVLIYFDVFNPEDIQEDYYGLGALIQDPATINIPGHKIKITFIPEEQWKEIIFNLMSEQDQQKKKAFVRSKIENYIAIHHHPPTSGEILQFISGFEKEARDAVKK